MITILTETGAYPIFDGEQWGRDDSGDVHVYDGQETLTTFDSETFVATLSGLAAGAQERLAREHLRSLPGSDVVSDTDTGTETVACGGDTIHPDDHDDTQHDQSTDHTTTDNNDIYNDTQ